MATGDFDDRIMQNGAGGRPLEFAGNAALEPLRQPEDIDGSEDADEAPEVAMQKGSCTRQLQKHCCTNE